MKDSKRNLDKPKEFKEIKDHDFVYIVTNITVKKIDRNKVVLPYPFPHLGRSDNVDFSSDVNDVNGVITVEHIEGEDFINAESERVIIGWSEEVQLALKLPFKTLRDQSKHIYKQYREICVLKDRLKTKDQALDFAGDLVNDYRGMNFLERLGFLFTGQKS